MVGPTSRAKTCFHGNDRMRGQTCNRFCRHLWQLEKYRSSLVSASESHESVREEEEDGGEVDDERVPLSSISANDMALSGPDGSSDKVGRHERFIHF
jgi:hypothetical protein